MKKVLVVLAALIVLAAAAFTYSRSTTHQLFGTIVPRVETGRKVVALTFDDGPDVPREREVFAALGGTKATFFLIGAAIRENPAAAARIVAAGHEIGNHSYHHDRMLLKSQAYIANEIESTDALIRAAGWNGPILVRPPYGKKLVGLPWYLAKHNRINVMWDVEYRNENERNAEVTKVVDSVRPGSIILMHPWYRNANTRAAIPLVIQRLREKGYDFVTVVQLLSLRR